MIQRPTFQLIHGDASKPSSWLNLPATAIGRSWTDRASLRPYRVAQEDVRKGLLRGLRQPLLDLWALVLGEVPPVPLSTRYSHLLPQLKEGSFSSASACFRGVRRPIGTDDTGYDVTIFVSKPRIMFAYEPSLSCVIKPMPFAPDLVFVTYAKLDYPNDPAVNARSRNGKGPSSGVITHWSAVEADPNDTDLPIKFDERYRERLW